MTDDQLHVPLRNERTLSTNSCECTSRDAVFDLETYGPYLDKIRELFVPSLEYRIHSLLEEFVYSGDSRWAVQFPYFKKFVDAIAAWRDPLIKAAEYDIGTMEKAIRSAVKRVAKDDLITCFLDSITLHYRLSKICRELDALGIEDDIVRSLNVWNFVNERKNRRADCFTDPDTAVDCYTNSMSSCDAKGSTRCERAIELTTNDVCPIEKNEVEQPTTSKCRMVDSNRDPHRRRKGDDSTRDASVSQDDDEADDKVVESLQTECTDVPKIRSFGARLKMIVRRMYPEDGSSLKTFSGSIVTCLALPCKPSDLIGRLFVADPSLTESCLIVMKRKFLMSVYNVCSCLNDILGKLEDVKFARTLYLNCEIHPGYIGFRLKSGNVNKCLFVSRIPICQNVRRRAIQRNSVISTCGSRLSTDAETGSRCSERRDDDGNNFNDTLARIDEESEEVDDTCCHMSRDECLRDLTTLSRKKSRENIAEETCDATSHVDKSEERDGKCHEISEKSSIEVDRENEAERECGGKIFDSDNSIQTMTNDEFTRVNDASCACSSSENLVETNREIENISSDKDPDSLSERDRRTRSPDKVSNLEDEDCNANTCSIASFVQNSERDKQLVELSCNPFLEDDISAIDKRMENDDSLNSEIGCDDFTDIIIDNIPGVVACAFEASRDELDVFSMRTRREHSSEDNDSLTVSVQTSRLRVSSKGIDVNLVSYPRTVLWLTSGEDDEDVEVAASPASIVPRKGREILGNKRVSDKTPWGFIRSSRRSPVSWNELRSNGDSKSFDISAEEYLRASRCCRSTSKFSASEFERSRKSTRRLSRLCVSSSNGFRSVTSFTAIKCGTTSRKGNDYSSKVRSQAILVMAKFRDSVDRSVDRIKRLIHANVRKILFNDGAKTNASKTFRKNEESSEDTTRVRTSGRCVRQGYSITSCSTSNCCYRHGCTLSSRESSNVILSIRRDRRREGMKFRDRRLIDGSECTLSTFRSIEASYDSLTPTVEDLEEHELSRSDRCEDRRERRIDQRSVVKNQNSRDFRKNYGTGVTISSAEVSGNESKYLERCATCERREETRDEKRDDERIHNRDRWQEMRRGCQGQTRGEGSIKRSSDESRGTSSSYIRRERVRNVRKQSRSDRSRARNAREGFASSDNDRLRKRRVFEILTDVCNDYALDDLDLDFRLHLLRYVKLCRSVKRALTRTLRSDFYDVERPMAIYGRV